MKNPKRQIAGALCLCIGLSLCGCLKSVSPQQNDLAEKGPRFKVAKPSSEELSPEETAEACLATADGARIPGIPQHLDR